MDDFPFLADIYQDPSPDIVVRKCAQVGMTVWAMMRFAHRAGVLGRSGIYYFPNDSAISLFVQARFDPFVDANPGIRAIIPKTDNVRLKRIGRGMGHFLGMKGKTQKLSTPADILIFDEMDAMPEGDIEVAEERTKASLHPEIHRLSTPTIPGYGVSRIFEQSDGKEWVMRCPHCSTWNVPSQMPFPGCVEQGFLACNKCRLALDVRMAGWVPARKATLSGYWIPRYISPRANIPKLLAKFRTALNVQNFYNSDMGLPYADRETRLSEADILRLCGSDPLSTTGEGCTMGIDVGSVLHVVVTRPCPNRMRELIWLGECGWGDVDGIIQRFGVKRFVMDALPEQHAARELVMRHRYRGWLCFYSDTQKGTADWNDEKRTVSVNRTESLDATQRLLREGLYLLPRRSDLLETFARHCAAIARKPEVDEESGAVRYVYVRVAADHFRHALNYDALNWNDNTVPSTHGGVNVLNPEMLKSGLVVQDRMKNRRWS